MRKPPNTRIFNDDGTVSLLMENGQKTLMDIDSLKFVNNRVHIAKHGYAILCLNSKNYYLHSLIVKAPVGMEIDHINGDTTDNRKCNLRLCTHQQNLYNCKKPKNNSSGYKGISWDVHAKKWVAHFNHNKHRVYVGLYPTIKEAVVAYAIKINEFNGEFARI